MKLKKILSLVVTLALVFSMVTISNVQAAEDEFAILKALGINADFSDDTTPITRIQLAEIALALSGDFANADGDPVYPDVPVKHKYFPIVNTVTNEGLMGPLADGSFGPEVKATGMDMGRVLLAELGYSAFGKQANWTDAQYNSKVQQLNLMRGVNASDGLTAREAGKMIVNMITTKVMEISTITSEGIKFTESNLTYIEHRYGYVLKTGEMQANGKASKTGYASVKVNQAVIDGVIYKTNGQNYSNYVGYYVKYVLTSPFEDAQLIHAEKYRPSEELVIQAEDIVNYVDYKLSYIDENGSTEDVNFSSATKIIINGQNASGYDARWFTPDHGSLTFVDTDGNEIYDVVNIETKVYFKVGGASSYSISDQWSLEVIETEDYDSVYVYNDGIGAELMTFDSGTYAEIAPGAVEYVTVAGNEMMKPDYANSDIMTINLVPTTTVSGKITGMNKKANSLIIDGVSYDLNSYYADLIASQIVKSHPIGTQIDAVINDKGQIIDIPNFVTDYIEVEDSLIYGYMISMNGVSAISKGAYIKMIDIYNLQEVVLKTADDCKLNGKEFDYSKVASVDPTTTSSSIYWPNGDPKHQLIKYSLNKDGEISQLYLAKDYSNPYLMTSYIGFSDTFENPDYDPDYLGYSSNDFSIDKAALNMEGDQRTLLNLYSLSTETMYLKIPADPTDLYSWTVNLNSRKTDGGLISYIKPFHPDQNDFELYDVNEDYSIGLLIERGAGSSGIGVNQNFTDESRSIIVTDINEVYDEISGEDKLQITGYQATPNGVKKVELIPTRNDLPSTTHYTDVKNNSTYPSMLWSEIEIGDIIRIAKNDAGLVAGFGLFVDKGYYTNLDSVPYGLLTEADYLCNYGYYIGYVTAVYGEVEGAMMNINGPTGNLSGFFKITQPRPKAGGNQSVGAAMIWDLSAKKGTMATCADLRVGDIALVSKTGGEINELFILRP